MDSINEWQKGTQLDSFTKARAEIQVLSFPSFSAPLSSLKNTQNTHPAARNAGLHLQFSIQRNLGNRYVENVRYPSHHTELPFGLLKNYVTVHPLQQSTGSFPEH